MSESNGSVDYRALPPVEPVQTPRRLSMTLLARDDTCPRSAYLQVRHKGGPGSHEMDRGTLLHAVLERALRTLVATGERKFAPEDPEQAASMMAAIVDEVLRERSDLVVPRAEVDHVREAAYHWAVAYDVDPEHVAGLEQLMVLDLDCGVTVSGRLDVIAFPSTELGQVDDYKSGLYVVPQEEYEAAVQPWVYAVLLCYGVPVVVEECEVCGGKGEHERFSEPGTVGVPDEFFICGTCEGRGYVEHRGEPIGKHLKGVWTREVYPRPKPRDDGLLHHREMLLARTAVADFKADLERQAERLMARFESGDFPARSGSWCSICPAPHECPLPPELRDHAGAINDVSQAQEAWEKVQHVKARAAAIEREVKNFAKAHDVEIRVGDEVWRWQPREGRALRRAGRGSDWDGLAAAVREAAEFGVAFDVSEWVKPTVTNEFKKERVKGEAQ
jgi:hypothetical protein